MHAVSTALSSGIAAWQDGTPDTDIHALQKRYIERHLMASGELFLDRNLKVLAKKDPRIYQNTSLLWNHTSRIVEFYDIMTYQGRLRAEVNAGAWPIVPDAVIAKDDEKVRNLLRAHDVLWRRWNWQNRMSLRPRYAAQWGDCPTELVDDRERKFVYPRIIWPGYITEIELDPADNVEAYTIEYQVTEELDNGGRDTYRYAKTVTEESFATFRDGKPHSYDGQPSEWENPYGFVPMVWDRHTIDPRSPRGIAPTDRTRQQLFAINSLATHARDFQHKQFLAPVLISGRMTARKESRIDLSLPRVAPPPADNGMAEEFKAIEVEKDAQLLQPTFDLGQTELMLERMMRGVIDEYPEIDFFRRLADQTQVTGPGADAILAPVKPKVRRQRDMLNVTGVHLHQMAITMAGWRVNSGAWGRELRNGRDAFRPYNLDSYDKGDLAYEVGDMPFLLPGEAETIERVRSIEGIQTTWGLEQLDGIGEETAQRIANERNARFDMALNRGAFGQDYDESAD